MSTEDSFIKMVRQAQLGDQGSMDWLAETARQRLYAYIYRLTLNHDLAQDLLQETLLKMVERISELKHPEGFWCWLFRTALGNVQHYYRTCAKERGIEFSQVSRERVSGYLAGEYEDELNRASRKELYEAVVDGMARLRLSYRNVLMLRCYEQMSYAEIAQSKNYGWPLATLVPDILSVLDLPDCYRVLKGKDLRQIEPWGPDSKPAP